MFVTDVVLDSDGYRHMDVDLAPNEEGKPKKVLINTAMQKFKFIRVLSCDIRYDYEAKCKFMHIVGV